MGRLVTSRTSIEPEDELMSGEEFVTAILFLATYPSYLTIYWTKVRKCASEVAGGGMTNEVKRIDYLLILSWPFCHCCYHLHIL